MTERWDSYHLHWDLFDPTLNGEPTPDEEARLRMRYDWAKARRSEVIEATISIENALDYFLGRCIVGTAVEPANRFRILVLSAEFCTLFQKWRMLRALLEDKALYPDPSQIVNRKENLRALHDLIEARNVYAHGSLSIDRKTASAYMNYFSVSTPMLVSEESISRLLSDAERLYAWLKDLYSYAAKAT